MFLALLLLFDEYSIMNCSWINALYNEKEKMNNCVNDSLILEYPCVVSDKCNPYYITIDRGTYLFEVYGAEGGGPNDETGKGGGIKAFFSIYSRQSFYAYVGAKGEQGVNIRLPQTFGGGGSGYSYTPNQIIGSGGGTSDIRRYKDDLSSRLIVAGGGGGSGKQMDTSHKGQSSGGDGSGANGLSCVTTNKGVPGSGAFTNRVGDNGVKGSFGIGGSPTTNDGSGGGGVIMAEMLVMDMLLQVAAAQDLLVNESMQNLMLLQE